MAFKPAKFPWPPAGTPAVQPTEPGPTFIQTKQGYADAAAPTPPSGFVANPDPDFLTNCVCCCPCVLTGVAIFVDYSSGVPVYCAPANVPYEVPAACPAPCGGRQTARAYTAPDTDPEPPHYAVVGNTCPNFVTVAPETATCNDQEYRYRQTVIQIKCAGAVVASITSTALSTSIAWPACTTGETCEIVVTLTYALCPCVLTSVVEFVDEATGTPVYCQPGQVEYEGPAPCPGLCDQRATLTAYTIDQGQPGPARTYWPGDACSQFTTVAEAEATCNDQIYLYAKTRIEIECGGVLVDSIESTDLTTSIAWPACTVEQSCTIKVILSYVLCPCVLDARVEFQNPALDPPQCEPGQLDFTGPAPCPFFCSSPYPLVALTADQPLPDDAPRYLPAEVECPNFEVTVPEQADCDGVTYQYVSTHLETWCGGSMVAEVDSTDLTTSIAWPPCTAGQRCEIKASFVYVACPCVLEARVQFINEMGPEPVECQPGTLPFEGPTPCPGVCDERMELTAYTADQPLPEPLPAYNPTDSGLCPDFELFAYPDHQCNGETYVYDSTTITLFCDGVEVDRVYTRDLVATMDWPSCPIDKPCRIEVDYLYRRYPACCPSEVTQVTVTNSGAKPGYEIPPGGECPDNFAESIWQRAFQSIPLPFWRAPCEFEIFSSCQYRLYEDQWAGPDCSGGSILYENSWSGVITSPTSPGCPCTFDVEHRATLEGHRSEVCVGSLSGAVFMSVYIRPLVSVSQRFAMTGGDCTADRYLPAIPGIWQCGPGMGVLGRPNPLPDYLFGYQSCPPPPEPPVPNPQCVCPLFPVSWSWFAQKEIFDHGLPSGFSGCDAVRWLADNPQILTHFDPDRGSVTLRASAGTPPPLAAAGGPPPPAPASAPTPLPPPVRRHIERPARTDLAGAVNRPAPVVVYQPTEQMKRHDARKAICDTCPHHHPPAKFGEVPGCALIPTDDGRAPCRREFLRIRLQGGDHPDKSCPWYGANV